MDRGSDSSTCLNCIIQQLRFQNPFGLEACWWRNRKTDDNQGSINCGFEDQSNFDEDLSPISLSTTTRSQSFNSSSSRGSGSSKGPYPQVCRFRCTSGIYSVLLILVVFVMLSPTVLSSPLFSSSIKVDESDETDQDYVNDLDSPQSEMLNYEENENDNATHTQPKWINPCGISSEDLNRLSNSENYPVTPLSEYEILQNILLTARNALGHSRHFNDHYVRNTFRSPNWKSHHEAWKNLRYEWLPLWPKHLGADIQRSHLDKLKVETTLKAMYNNLQRLAVGLEQVVLDQNIYDGKYLDEFNEAEFKLKAVLCELQIAMLEKGITPDEDVNRTIMAPEIRDIQDDSYRNLRDWYIFRDYMNGLEYAVHAFKHLSSQHQVKRSSPSRPRLTSSWSYRHRRILRK